MRLFSEIERISRLTKLVKKVGRLPVILGEVEDTQAGACTERGGEDLILSTESLARGYDHKMLATVTYWPEPRPRV